MAHFQRIKTTKKMQNKFSCLSLGCNSVVGPRSLLMLPLFVCRGGGLFVWQCVCVVIWVFLCVLTTTAPGAKTWPVKYHYHRHHHHHQQAEDLISTQPIPRPVTCLTADPGDIILSSISIRSHTFVEIDHVIISMAIRFKKGRTCQLQAKVYAQSTG